MAKARQNFTNVAAVIILFVVFVFGAFTSAIATPPSQETVDQNLEKVFEISKEIGNPEILQAILLQESGGQLKLPPPVVSRTHSYGIMQVQIGSARSIFQRVPDLLDTYFPNRKARAVTDKEIVDLLVTNDDANIRIAAYHFNLYLQLCDGNMDKAIAAYNVGIGAVKRIGNPSQSRYVKQIKTKLLIVQPFNALRGLQLTQDS